MSHLQEHVCHSIRARRLFRRAQPILVAVSGGLDSMVLLHVLHSLGKENGWHLTVAHLNHQLRGRSSDADERLVRKAASALKLPVIVERAQVRQFARTHKLSVEMAARAIRHEFLARTAAQLQMPSVAIAHHADDQLELFFLRLLRGSGSEGLAGMKWWNPSPKDPEIDLVRPLLDQSKADLRAYAAEHSIRFREDATNALVDIQRNLIRHELLPLLRKKYQPALDKVVLRLMELLRADSECLAQAAESWLERGHSCPQRLTKPRQASAGLKAHLFCELSADKNVRAPVSFGDLPVAVQRRCVQSQLLGLGVRPDFELVEKLRIAPDVLVTIGLSDSTSNQAPKQAIRDASGLVHLRSAERAEFKPETLGFTLKGRAGQVTFGKLRISWQLEAKPAQPRPKPVPGREFFDADQVGSEVLLRHWQPGDRFQPIGALNALKLQDFFTNEKVPRAQRHERVVAANAQGRIFWVEGMRISEPFKLSKQTNRRLQWRWRRV